MRKLKWGVLGTAEIARWGVIPGMQLADNCELYAIAGRKKEKVDTYCKKFKFEKGYMSYDELLADPLVEVVYIPLPNDLHYEWVMKAMKAGKHVLCEKPLAPTAKQVEELYTAAKEHNVILMEAFAYLHSPYIAALKEEIEHGTIGKVRYIESAFLTSDYEPNNIRMKKENYGGCTYDLGCYCTSMILALLGDMPENIQAIAEFSKEHVDIFTSAIMRFKHDVRASFICGMMLETQMSRRMDRLYIHGNKGYIRSNVEFNQSGDVSYILCVDGKEEEKTVSVRHNYCLEIEQLGRCITDGETIHVTKDFSIQNAKILDWVLKEINY